MDSRHRSPTRPPITRPQSVAPDDPARGRTPVQGVRTRSTTAAGRAREGEGVAVAPGGKPPKVVRLRSGARIIVQQTDRRGAGGNTVAIHLWVFAGTADEAPGQHGCAHLLEHMLFKPVMIGDERHDIASAIEALGGDVNAFTSHDETVFHATVPVPQFDAALRALVRPIANARPSAADLAHEAEVVIEEIKQYDDDPASRAMQDMVEGLYGDHGYGRPVLGLQAEVAAHRVAVLRRFLAGNYGGERLALVVAGPMRPAKVIASARAVLREFKARPRRRARVTPVPPATPRVVVRRDDVHEAHVALGWQAPPWPEAAACALELGATALGYGESSWLARVLRRRQGLVTDAHASLFAGRQGSSFTVTAHAPLSRVEASIVTILAEIDRMGRVAVDAEAHARARAVLESEVVYRRETVNGLAHTIGYYLSLGDDLSLDRTYLRHVATATPTDVRDAVAAHLVPRRASLAVVVPKSCKPADARALQRRLTQALRGSSRRRDRAVARADRHGIVATRLACGLRVRIVRDSSLAMAAGWMVWPGGQRAEPTKLAGATPLLAALLTRGTCERDGDTLAREIDGRAAVLDGMSGRNSVAMHFECLARDRELVLRRLFECAQSPVFAESELEHERRLALDDLAAERDDLAGLAFAAAATRLYGTHPYGRRRGGTRESLLAVDHRALRRLWAVRYPIGAATLGLCGDIDPEATLELLEALVAEAPLVEQAASWPGRAPRTIRGSSARMRRTKEQAHLVLAWPGLALADPRGSTMEVLTTILSAQAGRLFMAMREEEGLVYHVSASSSEGIDCGHVSFYAATSQAKLARARVVLERERERLCREPPSADEVERAQAWLVGQADASLQRRGRIASLLAFNEAYGLGYAAHFAYARKIEAVRPRDVMTLARTLLRPERQVTAIVAR